MGFRTDALVGDGTTFRDAESGDLADLAAIEREVQRRPWSREALAAELGRAHSSVVVAVLGGRVVGHSVFWCVAEEAEVVNLAVARDVQGQGIGRNLLEIQIARAGVRGARLCHLEVDKGNAAARGLYRSLGFEDVGTRRDYYGTDRPAIRMRVAIGRGWAPMAKGAGWSAHTGAPKKSR